ncbi:MAG: transcription elongation factor GreA [Saprospiraceae bacterium]|nr:transcription elongation factor GreA [Saprospiraceae bacterium]
MAEFNYMSKEGFDKLVSQLDELKGDGRKKAAQAIAEAREKGDLSENAEYDAAKDAQGMLEMKINELEKMMANARVLDADKINTSVVSILTSVTIKNLKTGFDFTYKIVSESEADLKQKKISVSSPMGKGLLGKKPGDIAKINTPAGEMEFKILDITA